MYSSESQLSHSHLVDRTRDCDQMSAENQELTASESFLFSSEPEELSFFFKSLAHLVPPTTPSFLRAEPANGRPCGS